MAKDFGIARSWAHEMLADALGDGCVAVDATMGNGHDTLFLCSLVGEKGLVYAFDVQPEALESTKKRLEDHNMASRARLILDGHQNMLAHLEGQADAVMFNLGWLPGGDKSVTTRVETTIAAVNAAAKLIKRGGLITICAYPGHDEGKKELEALEKWGSELNASEYDVMLRCYINQLNDPPVLLAVRRR